MLYGAVDITTVSLPNGVTGTTYSAKVIATGGCYPYIWKVSSGNLPPGLSGTGTHTTDVFTISGIPTTVGTYDFTVWVEGCGHHTSSHAYSVSVTGVTGCSSPTPIGAYTACNTAYHNAPSGTTSAVSMSPAPGNGVEIFANFGDSGYRTPPSQTLTVSDNINSPETCFTASPHSPYNTTNPAVPDDSRLYVWYCPGIPPGVTSFTVTASSSVINLQVNAVEWLAGSIAETNFFENVDDVVNSGSAVGTIATVTTSGPTVYANDLITGLLGNCGAVIPASPGTGYTGLIINPDDDEGYVVEAQAGTNAGTQTATITWSTGVAPDNCGLGSGDADDTWWGIIVPLVSATPLT